MLTRLRGWWAVQTRARRVQVAAGAGVGALVAIVVPAMLLGGGDETPAVVVSVATRTSTPTPGGRPLPTLGPGESGLVTARSLSDLVSKVGDAPDATRGRVRIPSIGVDAPLGVREVGDSGTMPLPAGPGDVVMYEFAPQWVSQYGGSLGGGAGNVVFSGHLDYQAKVPYAAVNYAGPGVFEGLSRLDAGDAIEVASGGRTLRYVVEWRRTVSSNADGWAEILGRDVGGEAITLITCGGSFSLQTLEYDSRVVVRASRQP